MIESITDKPCCKNWYITDRSYEFFLNVVISLIIIPQMAIHYNYPKKKLFDMKHIIWALINGLRKHCIHQ